MEINWEAADDDWENLLVPDDDLVPLYAPNAGRKRPYSTQSTSVGIAERRPTPGDAEQKQATEDGDKCTSDDNGNEETRHDITHSLGSPEQEFIGERSTRHRTRSHDSVLNQSNDEEPVSPEQVFSRALPNDIWLNVHNSDDDDGEQDVRLLSGMGRDRVTVIGGCCESSQQTGERASKRIREQDRNTGAGWDDPIVLGGGLGDCDGGGVPDEGESLPASPLLSSPEIPLVQEAADDRQQHRVSDEELPHPERYCALEREARLPVAVLGYKIPGPAGAVQGDLTSTGQRAKGGSHMERYFGPRRPSYRPSAAPDTLDFREGPWLAAMDFLNDGNSSSRSTIVTIKRTKGHVPQVVGVINTVGRNGFGDVRVTLKDPTGTIGGIMNKKVLTEAEDGHLIAPGAVMIIRKVAVFSPNSSAHYLNITMKNVEKIFGKDTIAPRRRRAVNYMNDSDITRRDHLLSEPTLDSVSKVQSADKGGCHFDAMPLLLEISGRQEVTDFTHALGNDERIPSVYRDDTSPRARENLPLKTMLEDVADARKSAATPNALDRDARASQDAIAKAAGWDDVELLLTDDFF